MLLQTVKKRSGQVVDFDEEKIVAALSKAFNGSATPSILKKILKRIHSLMDASSLGETVNIEEIQDIVEFALIKEGYLNVARDYMLFREEKRKIRDQKCKLLGVETLSEVEKRYSYSALKIFESRYLLRDNQGKVVERLDDLFRRVAVASGVMEVLYDEAWYFKDRRQDNFDKSIYENGKKVNEKYHFILDEIQKFNQTIDYKDINNNPKSIKIGDFILNPFHIERLFARWIELAEEGYMGIGWLDLLTKLEQDKEFQQKYLKQIQKYYDLMAHAVFLPNTPTLMNAGTKLGQLSACFTLDMEDSIKGIGQTNADVMEIFKSGGGIGINYSRLRPKGAYVKSTGGVSSGSISFLKIIDQITGTVAQAGKRRGASMGILDIDHPDLKEFIKIKNNITKELENHNISVCMNNHFFECFFLNKDYELVFDNQLYERVNAKDIMRMITDNVHTCGDPGAVFLENMNSNNLLEPVFGYPIKVTNPCSEISMPPYDSCNLASINMTKFAENGKFNVFKFMETCSIVTQFLDGVIDANKYPLERINEISKSCRRIGLGMMGMGDLLTLLEVPYNSEKGFTVIEYLSALMTGESLNTSAHMANIKGAFPYYYKEEYRENRHKLPVNAVLNPKLMDDLEKRMSIITDIIPENMIIDVRKFYENIPNKEYGLRNCSVTTNAPTGSLSMFTDVSSSIEPIFSHGYTKKVTIGDFNYINKFLERALQREGIKSDKLIAEIVQDNNGRLQSIKEIPEKIRNVFVTSMEIHYFDHIMAQAVAQRWISNGISKTINGPHDMTSENIEHCYVLSWALGNKGVTAYRDGSKHTQVLNNNAVDKKKSNLRASDYTVNVIKSLDNIPEEYKQELLKACNHMDTLPDPIITETHTKSVYCPSCGAANSLQSGGGRCQLCIACGTGIGSCN